jgi:hypothetical protein
MTEQELKALDRVEAELRMLLPPSAALVAALDVLCEPAPSAEALLAAASLVRADWTGQRTLAIVVLLAAISNSRRLDAPAGKPEKVRR